MAEYVFDSRRWWRRKARRLELRNQQAKDKILELQREIKSLQQDKSTEHWVKTTD